MIIVIGNFDFCNWNCFDDCHCYWKVVVLAENLQTKIQIHVFELFAVLFQKFVLFNTLLITLTKLLVSLCVPEYFKVELSPSKKLCFICFNENPLKIMKNAFYFILKALFVLKIFKFLCWLFDNVEKTAWFERKD